MEHGEGSDEVLERLSSEQVVLENAIILVRIPQKQSLREKCEYKYMNWELIPGNA